MDKNVGNVDIDELKRAREALNEERGIENDPNMYNSYNPNAPRDYEESAENLETENLPSDYNSEDKSEDMSSMQQEEQEPISENSLDSQTNGNEKNSSEENVSADDLIDIISSAMASDSSDQNNDLQEEQVRESSQTASDNGSLDNSQKDFDVYDKFSAFEVAPSKNEQTEDSQVINNLPNEEKDEESPLDEVNDGEVEEVQNAEPEDQNDKVNVSGDDNSENLLSSIGTIDFDSMKNDSAQNAEDKQNSETDPKSENLEVELEFDKNAEGNEDLSSQNGDENENPLENVSSQNGSNVQLENSKADLAEENSADKGFNTEVIDDYRKLENLDKLISEEDQRLPEIDIEKPKIEYADIEPFEFVDLISTDEFKNSDKISYILGKDESGKVCYGNLRDLYNIAIFGKENNSVVSLVHSIIISLILKNGVSDMSFVICDSKADSKFEVYDKSTYMYFNRIAKTNKEILDSLIELTKELEERYKILATTGVKSIEQYNIIAKNDNLKPLPYLLLVYNNYSKSSQLTEADKINTCLYQLLKLGRCVGMYEIIIANTSIKSDEINYNLPTRITFLSDDEDDSLETFGEVGAEQLPTSSDFLLSSIEKSKVMHLRVPNITKSEIEVLIESINE